MERRKHTYRAPTGWERFLGYLGRLLPYALLALFSLPILSMYLWLLLSSFSRKVMFGFIPQEWTLHNWRFLWEPIRMGGAAHLSIWKAAVVSSAKKLMIAARGIKSMPPSLFSLQTTHPMEIQ